VTEVHVEGRKVKDDEKPPKVTQLFSLLTAQLSATLPVEHGTQSRQCLAAIGY